MQSPLSDHLKNKTVKIAELSVIIRKWCIDYGIDYRALSPFSLKKSLDILPQLFYTLFVNYYFSADYHLGHKNICKYCNRPFGSVQEMNEIIIKNHNSLIKPKDTFYFLGDFCFGNEKVIAEFLRRLNGNIKILFGNHDKTLRKFAKKDLNSFSDLRDRIEFLGDYKELEINNQHIVLSHYAFRVFNRSHYGAWNLWGHSHGSLPDDPHLLSIDIGIDCNNYFPFSLEKISEIMKKKFWKPIDHHGKRLEGGGIGLNKEDYAKLDRKRQYEQLRREFET